MKVRWWMKPALYALIPVVFVAPTFAARCSVIIAAKAYEG